MAAKPKLDFESVRNNDTGENSTESRTKSQRMVECDFKDIQKTGKYFEEKFNDIVSKCVNEVNKIANLDLQSWTEGWYHIDQNEQSYRN